jgi:protein-S-isoprenylcysteine O-methyltransferase Ste14
MKSKSPDWKQIVGNFLFQYRSFTPLPLMLLIFLGLKPRDMGALNIWVTAGGLLLALGGELIRILAVGFSATGTSGRENFLKAESINTTGVYSLSRNPLYIGNIFIFFGLLMVFNNGFALLIGASFLILQYYFIILAEEKFLVKRHGEAYQRYCRRVPRIFSGFRTFQRPDTGFDFRKVLFKEDDSVFNLMMVFVLILAVRELTFDRFIIHKLEFILSVSILCIFYIFIKVLKKRKKTGQ